MGGALGSAYDGCTWLHCGVVEVGVEHDGGVAQRVDDAEHLLFVERVEEAEVRVRARIIGLPRVQGKGRRDCTSST